MNEILKRMTERMEAGLKEHISETEELPEAKTPEAPPASTLHNPFADELLGDDDGSTK